MINHTFLNKNIIEAVERTHMPAFNDLLAEKLFWRANLAEVNDISEIEIIQKSHQKQRPMRVSVKTQDKKHAAPPIVETKKIPISKIADRISLNVEVLQRKSEAGVFEVSHMVQAVTQGIYEYTEEMIFNGYEESGVTVPGYLNNPRRIQVKGADSLSFANFKNKSEKIGDTTKIFNFFRTLKEKLFTPNSETSYIYCSPNVYRTIMTRPSGVGGVFLDVYNDLIQSGVFKAIRRSKHIPENQFLICNLGRHTVELFIAYEILVRNRTIPNQETVEYDVCSSMSPIIKEYLDVDKSEFVHVFLNE